MVKPSPTAWHTGDVCRLSNVLGSDLHDKTGIGMTHKNGQVEGVELRLSTILADRWEGWSRKSMWRGSARVMAVTPAWKSDQRLIGANR